MKHRSFSSAILGLAILWLSSSAHAECEKLPGKVSTYLTHMQGWSLVSLKSLAPNDRTLWRKFHAGKYPGIAEFDPDGHGLPTYALAILKYSKIDVLEKLVVVGQCACSLAVLSGAMNIKSTDVPAISVVWRVPPGRYVDVTSGRATTIRHDGVVYEKMEAGALLYYLNNGHYHEIQTSE
jgi:hypothetical protein